MKMMRTLILIAMLSMVLPLVACSKVKEDGNGFVSPPLKNTASPKAADSEPVTLNVLWSGNQASFDDRVANDINRQKLPNITAKYYKAGELSNLMASGVKLDVMNVGTGSYYTIRGYKLNYDMIPLIKQENFDLSRFVPEHLEAIKGLSKNGRMDAVPDKANFPYALHAILYNKDIFDKFGVPYPTDNMTWDQILQLAKQLTRKDGSIKYYGIQMPSVPIVVHSLALNYTDANNKADLSNPLFTKVTQLFRDAYQITGSLDKGAAFENNNVAMYGGNIEAVIEGADQRLKNVPNWDIVTFPHFDGMPLTVPPTEGVYMIASTSEHKVEALKLIDALLSKENTQKMADGFMNSEFLTKNVNAVKTPKQAVFIDGQFDDLGNSLLGKVINDMNQQDMDVNTALRNAQDQLQLQINEKLKQ